MNDEALTAVLPESAAANWRRTSPVAVLFFFGRILKIAFDAGWAAIAPIWAAISSGKGIWIIPGILVVLVLFAAWAGLSWLRFRYRLDGNKLLVRRGVIQREKLTIEFDKVQNTRVLEPFYVRPFGLALFEIDTAGSAGKEVTLGGIELDLARRLRDQVVVEQRPTGDDEATITNADATLVLSRTPKDIALYGLTHNGLLWVAVLFGAVMSQVDWDDGGPVTNLIKSMDLASFGALSIVLIALFFAALLALLLPLLSIAGAFWRYHGYQLFRDGETWRRHSGLVSKHDESVKQHKVQALVWKQNFVARALGRINLQLQQASAGVAVGNAGAAAAAKRRFVVPALKPDDAATLSAQLLPDAAVGETQFSRVHRKYIRKNLLWGWSWVAAGLCVFPTIAAGWTGLLVFPAIMLLGWLIVSQRWRKLGFAARGDYGLVRTGFIGTRITVFPLFKVQRVDIHQSPSQQRHDLANLRIHLASQSISVDWMSLADAHKFHDLALYHVETSEQNWF